MLLNFAQINGFVKVVTWIFLSCYMDLSKLIHEFLLVLTWICQSCHMDLLKLLHWFVKVVLCFFFPNAKENQLKTKILKLVEAFILNLRCWISQSFQCRGSFVLLAMYQDQCWDQFVLRLLLKHFMRQNLFKVLLVSLCKMMSAQLEH